MLFRSQAFVETMVEVFREVRRVLHSSGTCWLNLGDSYTTGSGGNGTQSEKQKSNGGTQFEPRKQLAGMKPKDLCLIPWRVVLALQADGWWVRSVIVWHKKSCMPESVNSRPTNSWEPIFLLAKSAKYFYDAEAVKEQNTEDMQLRAAKGHTRGGNGKLDESRCDHDTLRGEDAKAITASGRNQRNVWSLGPEPFSGSHFAVFPTEIPRRAILAGTSERGCCPKCLAPWERVVEKGDDPTAMPLAEKPENGRTPPGHATVKPGSMGAGRETRTVGWQPTCKCDAGEPIPCTVCDPFGGSGTTGQVAIELGRKAILIELNEKYHDLIDKRTKVTQGFAF